MADSAFTLPLYNRERQVLEQETVYAPEILQFLYQRFWGRLLLEWVMKRRFFSLWYGNRKRRSCEQSDIETFARLHNINCDELAKPLQEYTSFNAFFCRELKPEVRPVDTNPHALVSPADARLSVLPINDDFSVTLKEQPLSLPVLLRSESLGQDYRGGWCLLFRLAVEDYHHFGHVASGVQTPIKTLSGFLHSVHPIALMQGIAAYKENQRDLSLLHTEHFSQLICLEVGALTVGRIRHCQPEGGAVSRGSKKGWFELGGSSIIVLVKPGCLQIDADILHYSQQGIETRVKYGERVGCSTVC